MDQESFARDPVLPDDAVRTRYPLDHFGRSDPDWSCDNCDACEANVELMARRA